MRKGLIAGTVVVIAVFGLTLVGWAVEESAWDHHLGPRGPERMAPRLLALLGNDRVKSELGLTDQQVERLRQVVVDAEKSSIKTRAEIAIRRIELRELLRADNPDRKAILNKVQEISNLQGEMMKQHVDALLTAKTVLTPEQQKKIRTFIESRHAARFGPERFGPHPRRLGPPPEPPGKPPRPPIQ